MLKLVIFYFIRFLLSFFKIFQLKQNRCFFESYQGTQFSCNPKYIYLELLNSANEYECIWSLFIKKKLTIGNAKIVKPRSFKYYYYLVTSKYVFTNIELSSFIPKKKNAVWINTWHGGGAFKKVEHDSKTLYQKIAKKIVAEKTDYYISSSKKFTEIMSHSTGININKFLNIGMPRNDILFLPQNEKEKIKNGIREFYRIASDAFIVLYAPTYRGGVKDSKFVQSLDFEQCKSCIEKRFEKNVVFLMRTHHLLNNSIDIGNVIDAKSYPDMQELIIASDMLITDYSSSIWDYSFTNKPCFLFVPDLDEYINTRGLYTSIDEWPFSYANDNDSLCQLIINFDEQELLKRINMYHRKLDSYDKGVAVKELIRILTGEEKF